jgi:hypothetical protein
VRLGNSDNTLVAKPTQEDIDHQAGIITTSASSS